MSDYASDESDHDPDFDPSKHPESADIHDTPTYESSSEDEQTDTDTATAQTQEESPSSMTRPSRVRQTEQRFKTTHTPRPPCTPTPSEILWNTDPTHKQERLSWIGKEVTPRNECPAAKVAKIRHLRVHGLLPACDFGGCTSFFVGMLSLCALTCAFACLENVFCDMCMSMSSERILARPHESEGSARLI